MDAERHSEGSIHDADIVPITETPVSTSQSEITGCGANIESRVVIPINSTSRTSKSTIGSRRRPMMLLHGDLTDQQNGNEPVSEASAIKDSYNLNNLDVSGIRQIVLKIRESLTSG